jgi:hypothetical protein
MFGAGLASLSDIPADPDWCFPGLSFDENGFALPPDWSNEFVALRQSSERDDAPPGRVPEPWNTFALAGWDAGDGRFTEEVFEQNSVEALMALIRGR